MEPSCRRWGLSSWFPEPNKHSRNAVRLEIGELSFAVDTSLACATHQRSLSLRRRRLRRHSTAALHAPRRPGACGRSGSRGIMLAVRRAQVPAQDRKSTRLNSSHLGISYAVFCLKKKNNTKENTIYIG